MFEKKVIGALRSPALVADLKTYQRELVRRTKKRGWLVLLLLLLVGLQCVPLLLAESRSTSSDPSDTLSGGTFVKQDALIAYDNKKSDFNHLASSLQLSRDDMATLAAQNQDLFYSGGSVVEWTKIPTYRSALPYRENSVTPVFALAASEQTIFYGYNTAPLKDVAKNKDVLVGNSKKAGQFAVIKQSGNIITSWDYAEQLDMCYKKPGESLSYLHCANGVNLKTSTEVLNLSRKNDARFIKSRPNNLLQYSLRVQNNNPQAIRFTPEVYVGDITQYARIESSQGARFNPKTQTLRWKEITLAGSNAARYDFTARVAPEIALTANNTRNLNSYDCQLSTFFGSERSISLLCPAPKVIERFLQKPLSRSMFALLLIILVINIFLYARSRTLAKEAKLILEDLRKA